MASQAKSQEQLPPVDIKPLLSKLWPINATVDADEIANAISHFFTNQVTEAQTASLLMALHFTKLDFVSEVLARCAQAMRRAAEPIPVKELQDVIDKRGRKEGLYSGGLVRSRYNQTVSTLYHFADHCSCAISVTLLGREVTLTTPSTSARRRPSLPRHCCSSPSMATGRAPPSPVAPIL